MSGPLHIKNQIDSIYSKLRVYFHDSKNDPGSGIQDSDNIENEFFSSTLVRFPIQSKVLPFIISRSTGIDL